MTDESIYFVVNPNSRGGKTKKLWKNYLKKIDEIIDSEYDFCMADGIGQGRKLTTQGIEQGYKKFVAVGGEGTVNEVVNSIYFSKKNSVSMSFIKSGTVNDYQQVLDWPNEIEEQLLKIKNGKKVSTPLTLVTGDTKRVALNLTDVGVGASAAYMASVERRLIWIRSQLRYTLLVLRAMRKWKNIPCEINIGDRYLKGDLSLLMAGFSSQTGEYIVLPHANTFGEQLAYVVALDFSKFTMIKQMKVIKKGDHTEEIEGIFMGFADKIEIQADKPLLFETDGEPFSYNSSYVTIEAVPNAINIIQ